METTTKKQPIKRDPNLVPLSREHHFGLLFAWKIKQGLAKNASLETMRDYVLYFWETGLQEHFLAEEDLLLNILPATDVQRYKILREHETVRKLIDQIEAKTEFSEAVFETLHTYLTDHIRYEERTFFPYLEQQASLEQLTKIGKHLAEEYAEPEDNFQPEFWVSK
ncbi:hemerythrin domain-containing protein [Adhaeribacter sp. BT258]|uniref:Hemerythrin domain-containing protein n=1 Tax=Adhaeribacter terrigena TaxID=2793070 RepID=A0ABS1BZ18_9BACT|nr:hemerythrin domain-containing protein [Adhaeribacter terrigena]MBK0402391.1 hemerythrin domain-containing protein [Adhaeribacter terrigena]